jgi:hypothetical protein
MKLKLIQSYPGCGLKVGECIEFPDDHNIVCKYIHISEYYQKSYMSTSHNIGCATFDKVGEDYYRVTWNINELLRYPHLWEVVKIPLFITDDGCPIYKGEEYLEVDELFRINLHINAQYVNTYPCFKQRQNALEYVRLNKPRYSVKEINNALDRTYGSSPWRRIFSSILGLDN